MPPFCRHRWSGATCADAAPLWMKWYGSGLPSKDAEACGNHASISFIH
tara:strand:+ start:383 stop:526 length:144 start_codon:yes stop_codon:yes gene_type:complete